MAIPVTVGARALKARLGGYLRRVRAGRTVVITDRGIPVAEMRPLAVGGGDDAVIDRLQALGVVAAGAPAPLSPLRPIRQRRAALSAAVLEDRADRL
jgi:antitoxin (DNA-binding transcriptional repressor) of toxin-antitoxin stability system